MEIIRKLEDGTELKIKLTDEEVENTYREQRKHYDRCDLIHKMNLMTEEDGYDDHLMCVDDAEYEIGQRIVTGKQLRALFADEDFMNDLIDEFEDCLDNNDVYWEMFWDTAGAVIELMIDERVSKSEKELKREANQEKYKTLIDEIQRSSLSYFTQRDIIDRLINEGV